MNDRIRSRSVSVTTDDGKTASALLVSCPCGLEIFHVMQILVGNSWHLHLQCVHCDRTFCDGSCSAGTAAEGSARCRVCGCTDGDCSGCIERTGRPCHWIEPDLCSACAGPGGTPVRRDIP